MKRVGLVVAIAGFLLFGAKSAFATDPGCAALGGTDGAGPPGPCVVPAGAHVVSGSITVAESLHLLTGAILDASASGVTLTVNPGSFEMDKGSAIHGGTGGSPPDGQNITINVPNGDMTMHGTPPPGGNQTDKCAYPAVPDPALGAQITSVKSTLTTTITINVGNFPAAIPPPPIGSFTMERCSLVDASNRDTGGQKGPAGTVVIKAGRETDIDGEVLSESTLTGVGANQPPGGGPITVQSGCRLTVSKTGVVSSKGADPGADLVHIEGCDVFIDGLVQSTGPGHGPPTNPPNHCATDGPNGDHSAKPANSTGCIEIIGQNITISNTGEVNADVNSTGSGGTQGTSWIDLFAYDNITIVGRTGATDVFSVHADTASGSDNTPNTVTAKAGQDLAFPGTFTGTGRILSAGIIGAANGSNGGTVVVEAAGIVNLDTSTIKANGDNVGGTAGACDSGSGACGSGGQINVRSFNANITWQNGVGNVNPDESSIIAGSVPGTVSLIACTSVNTFGTNFDDAVPAVQAATYTNSAGVVTNPGNGLCGGLPVVPDYVTDAFEVGEPIWEACVPKVVVGSKSGRKFNDGDVNKPGLNGWTIHLFGTEAAGGAAVHTTQVTHVATAADVTCTLGTDGCYYFGSLNPGTYHVCEQLQSSWTQSFPTAATPNVFDCDGPPNPDGDNPTPGPLGYTFVITNAGENHTGNDFGNKPNVSCPEDANSAPKLTRTVGQSQFNFGAGVPGNPKNYSTIQLAYNDALLTGQSEVIGLFANTTENLVLNGSKSLTITQCTVARVTAADSTKPVWDITSTGHLTIISPDSVGGTVGWLVETGPHDLKSIRADGASVAGIKVLSNGNSISWNDADGNAIGVDVLGNNNTLKGGSVSNNTGVGVHFGGTASNNTLSGATIESNGSHGVLVEGTGSPANKITSNTANKNKGDGFNNNAANTNFASNKSNDGSSGGSKENVGKEYRFVKAGVNGNGNKADGVSVPAAAKGCTSFAAGQACE